MKKIGIGTLFIGCLVTSSFAGTLTRADKLEIVFDTTSNIVWQDDKSVVKNHFFDKKDKATKYCSNLVLNGIKDWRLPSINEYAGVNLLEFPFVYHNNTLYWSSNNKDNGDAIGYSYTFGGSTGSLTGGGQVICVKDISGSSKLKQIQAEIEDKKTAERDQQAEYDRKHQCDGFYPGKNFKVYTSGLFSSGAKEARVTGVDKEGGQVSFEWKRGPGDWKSEETTCSYLKTQMR